MPTPPSDPVTAEGGWDKAQKVAGLLGPFPPPITKAIKSLWEDHLLARAVPCDQSKKLFAPVEKSPKLMTPLRAAAAELAPRPTAPTEPKSPSDLLLETLGPGLSAVCLFFIFLHRRGSKINNSPDWPKLAKDLIANMELGYSLGLAAPKLAPAQGMLLGGIRHGAMMAYMVENPDAYGKYRLKGSKKFDFDYEREWWGCDHSQVAAFLLMEAGFRKDSLEVATALRKHGKTGVNLPDDLNLWRSAAVFIDHLKSGICPPPDPSHIERLGIPSSNTHQGLKAKYSQIYDQGPSFEWILKTTKDAE